MTDLFEVIAIEDIEHASQRVQTFFDDHYALEKGFDPEEVVACVVDSLRETICQRSVLSRLSYK